MSGPDPVGDDWLVLRVSATRQKRRPAWGEPGELPGDDRRGARFP